MTQQPRSISDLRRALADISAGIDELEQRRAATVTQWQTEASIQLQTGEDHLHSLVRVGPLLFTAPMDRAPAPTTLIRLRTDTLESDRFVFPDDQQHCAIPDMTYDSVSQRVLIVFGGRDVVRVWQCDPLSLPLVATPLVEDAAHPVASSHAITTSADGVWVLSQVAAGATEQLRLTQYDRSGACLRQVLLPDATTAAACRCDGRWVWVVGAQLPSGRAYVARVDVHDGSETADAVLDPDDTFFCDDVAVDHNTYVFTGPEAGTVGHVVRINKHTLAYDTIPCGTNAPLVGIANAGDKVLALWGRSSEHPQGCLTVVDPDIGQAQATYVPDVASEDGPNEIVTDESGRAYVTCWQSSPAVVARLASVD